MWTISKEFKFDFGHRVWTQSLDKNLALSTQCICKRLHGHEGKVKVELTAEDSIVYKTGMITDFKHLNFFKKFLDDHLDHRFLIHVDDPFLVYSIINIVPPNNCYLYGMVDGLQLYKIQNDKYESNTDVLKDIKAALDHSALEMSSVGLRIAGLSVESDEDLETINYFESFVITSFVPTAENLCKYFHQWLQTFFDRELPYVKVKSVTFYETSKSFALYTGD